MLKIILNDVSNGFKTYHNKKALKVLQYFQLRKLYSKGSKKDFYYEAKKQSKMTYKFLTQEEAQKIDEELMSEEGGFSVYQLMELAGFSVAQAIQQTYSYEKFPKILICCGPGNNGGDGLVAARHLKHFGYEVVVHYPKQNQKELFKGLVTQLENLSIPIQSHIVSSFDDFNLIVDAVFGFSFKVTEGGIREPFDKIVKMFKLTKIPIVAVDIPSGWNVNNDYDLESDYMPEMLVSLTAPKLCAKKFKGKYHYLGGRFVPNSIINKYDLQALPKYTGSLQCTRL